LPAADGAVWFALGVDQFCQGKDSTSDDAGDVEGGKP
jgi:hypothetical protein